MSSARKIAANRANSQRSTGPKSEKGKSRASKNARRHGLSLPVSLNPTLSKEVEDLAQEIAGNNSDRKILDVAHLFADAQIDLERISRVRFDLLGRYHRYFDLALTTEEDSSQALVRSSSGDAGSDHEGEELARRSLLEQLVKIERYELRARSKRKFATRMLVIAFGAKRRAESQAQ